MVSAETLKRLQTWVWVFVYGGILVIGIGLTAWRNDSTTGAVVTVIGAVLLGIGALLVWIRSRLRTESLPPPAPNPPKPTAPRP